MISDTDVDAFLEHFGVLGMKWGVRNKPKKETRTPAQIKEARRKNVKKALVIGGAAAVVAAGTAFVIYKMRSHGKTPVSKLPKPRMSAAEMNKGLDEAYKKGSITDGRWLKDRDRGPQPKPDFWDEGKLGPWVIPRERTHRDIMGYTDWRDAFK